MLLSQGRLYPFAFFGARGGDGLGTFFFFSWLRGYITPTPLLGGDYAGFLRFWRDL
jgi:hypothetical protein